MSPPRPTGRTTPSSVMTTLEIVNSCAVRVTGMSISSSTGLGPWLMNTTMYSPSIMVARGVLSQCSSPTAIRSSTPSACVTCVNNER